MDEDEWMRKSGRGRVDDQRVDEEEWRGDTHVADGLPVGDQLGDRL